MENKIKNFFDLINVIQGFHDIDDIGDPEVGILMKPEEFYSLTGMDIKKYVEEYQKTGKQHFPVNNDLKIHLVKKHEIFDIYNINLILDNNPLNFVSMEYSKIKRGKTLHEAIYVSFLPASHFDLTSDKILDFAFNITEKEREVWKKLEEVAEFFKKFPPFGKIYLKALDNIDKDYSFMRYGDEQIPFEEREVFDNFEKFYKTLENK